MKRYLILIAGLLFLFNSMTAFAADENPISIVSAAEVEETVINEQGEKEVKRVPASKVMPGGEVIFSNTCTNASATPIENVVINNPIPEQMIYIEESAGGAGTIMTFSVDNGQNFDAPKNLFIVEQDGTTRLATGSDYTHIRWTFEGVLEPEESKVVEFRARVK